MKDEFVIHIDGTQFKVETATMSGAQLKALANKDATYQLFLEQHGDDPDRPIPDTESVTIHNGQHFYTLPPATLG